MEEEKGKCLHCDYWNRFKQGNLLIKKDMSSDYQCFCEKKKKCTWSGEVCEEFYRQIDNEQIRIL